MISLKKRITIAIDGYSSCGKSSFAKLIATELAYLYIDRGAMYRAVSLFAISNKLISTESFIREKLIQNLHRINISFEKSDNGYSTLLNGENVENRIRDIEVSSVVSEISKVSEVRERLVQMQREMGRDKGIVMDGRDIGTIVFPDAELKIFMSADPAVRAKRRYDELIGKGMPAIFKDIEANIKKRDHIDTNREISPLCKAEDALVLDNTHMTFDEQMLWFRQVLINKDLLEQQ